LIKENQQKTHVPETFFAKNRSAGAEAAAEGIRSSSEAEPERAGKSAVSVCGC